MRAPAAATHTLWRLCTSRKHSLDCGCRYATPAQQVYTLHDTSQIRIHTYVCTLNDTIVEPRPVAPRCARSLAEELATDSHLVTVILKVKMHLRDRASVAMQHLLLSPSVGTSLYALSATSLSSNDDFQQAIPASLLDWRAKLWQRAASGEKVVCHPRSQFKGRI